MHAPESRLDPQELTRKELRQLTFFTRILTETEAPALLGPAGERLDLPKPIYEALLRVAQLMRDGKPVVLLPEDEALTTQAAANMLGVSRPHLVKVLDAGQIPHHLAGTHRRVYLKDVLAYGKKRDASRRKAMDVLNDEVEAAGLYDK